MALYARLRGGPLDGRLYAYQRLPSGYPSTLWFVEYGELAPVRTDGRRIAYKATGYKQGGEHLFEYDPDAVYVDTDAE